MIIKRLVVVTGKYSDKNGKERRNYVTIGHVHSGARGEYLTLEPSISLAGLYAQQQAGGLLKQNERRLFVNAYDEDASETGNVKLDKKPDQNPESNVKQPDFNEDIPF